MIIELLYYQNERRLRNLNIIVIVLLGLIIASLWYIQIISGSKYADLSKNNRIRLATRCYV